MKEIQADDSLCLQVVVTGIHLSPEFGLTYKTIENDGFPIDEKVEMLLSSDTATGVTKSIGLGIIGFAGVWERLKPDLIVVLGDRFEMLAVAQSALIALIPVAHIAGGDVTEGAFDEAIRHSITKMSHLHFVTNEKSADRVRQLGENPTHVYIVGSPGLDYLPRMRFLNRQELEQDLGFKFLARNLLVTFHPSTLDSGDANAQFDQLLAALEQLHDTGLWFTYPNADPQGRRLISRLEEFVATHKQAKAFSSLGQLRYLSLMAQVDAVAGNSSSGLYEAPSFRIPTVNIGDRQRGRLQALSVLNCEPYTEDILATILKSLQMDCSSTVNPYGDGNSSARILSVLKSIDDYRPLVKKSFFEVAYEK
jgi:UDP-N-acetylglucosamine 2-epimerase (non-hydrolysing)/GDP/UDP-N,N'-diacetylbacillosamine 2-epimerase (hydrolysing)